MSKSTERSDVHKQFLSRKPLAETLFNLYDCLADVYFYAKDRNSRFTHANRNTLTTYDLSDMRSLLGRTDADFHPPGLANAYIAEDRHVMESRRPILNQIWLVPHVMGLPRWFVSSKVPLFDSDGEVVGLAGAMVRVDPPKDRSSALEAIQPAMGFLEQHYSERVTRVDLAKSCGLSATSVNRHFRRLLRTTPTTYQLALRVEAARRALVTSDAELSRIAMECGFADQSHFTRRFREVTGITPLQYRRKFRDAALSDCR